MNQRLWSLESTIRVSLEVEISGVTVDRGAPRPPDLPSGTEFTAFLSLSEPVEIECGTAWDGRAAAGDARGCLATVQGRMATRLQACKMPGLQGRKVARSHGGNWPAVAAVAGSRSTDARWRDHAHGFGLGMNNIVRASGPRAGM